MCIRIIVSKVVITFAALQPEYSPPYHFTREILPRASINIYYTLTRLCSFPKLRVVIPKVLIKTRTSGRGYDISPGWDHSWRGGRNFISVFSQDSPLICQLDILVLFIKRISNHALSRAGILFDDILKFLCAHECLRWMFDGASRRSPIPLF